MGIGSTPPPAQSPIEGAPDSTPPGSAPPENTSVTWVASARIPEKLAAAMPDGNSQGRVLIGSAPNAEEISEADDEYDESSEDITVSEPAASVASAEGKPRNEELEDDLGGEPLPGFEDEKAQSRPESAQNSKPKFNREKSDLDNLGQLDTVRLSDGDALKAMDEASKQDAKPADERSQKAAKALYKRYVYAESTQLEDHAELPMTSAKISSRRKLQTRAKMKTIQVMRRVKPKCFDAGKADKDPILKGTRSLNLDRVQRFRDKSEKSSQYTNAEVSKIRTAMEASPEVANLSEEELALCIAFKDSNGDYRIATPVKNSSTTVGSSWEKSNPDADEYPVDFAGCYEFKAHDGKPVRVQYTFDGTQHRKPLKTQRRIAENLQNGLSDIFSRLYSESPEDTQGLQATLTKAGSKFQGTYLSGGGQFYTLATVGDHTSAARPNTAADSASFGVAITEEGFSMTPIMAQDTDEIFKPVDTSTMDICALVTDGITGPIEFETAHEFAHLLIDGEHLNSEDWAKIYPDAGAGVEDIEREYTNRMGTQCTLIINALSYLSPEEQAVVKETFGLDKDAVVQPANQLIGPLEEGNRALQNLWQEPSTMAKIETNEAGEKQLVLTENGKKMLEGLKKSREELEKKENPTTNEKNALGLLVEARNKGKEGTHVALARSRIENILIPQITSDETREQTRKLANNKFNSQAGPRMEAALMTQLMGILPGMDPDQLGSPDAIKDAIINEFDRKQEVAQFQRIIDTAKDADKELRKASAEPEKVLAVREAELSQVQKTLEADRQKSKVRKVITRSGLSKSKKEKLKSKEEQLTKNIDSLKKEIRPDEERQAAISAAQEKRDSAYQALKEAKGKMGLLTDPNVFVSGTAYSNEYCRQDSPVTVDGLKYMRKTHPSRSSDEFLTIAAHEIQLNDQQKELVSRAQKGLQGFSDNELEDLQQIYAERGHLFAQNFLQTSTSVDTLTNENSDEVWRGFLEADTVHLQTKPAKRDFVGFCIQHRLAPALSERLPENPEDRAKIIEQIKQGTPEGRSWVESNLSSIAKEKWTAYADHHEKGADLPKDINKAYCSDIEDDTAVSTAVPVRPGDYASGSAKAPTPPPAEAKSTERSSNEGVQNQTKYPRLTKDNVSRREVLRQMDSINPNHRLKEDSKAIDTVMKEVNRMDAKGLEAAHNSNPTNTNDWLVQILARMRRNLG